MRKTTLLITLILTLFGTRVALGQDFLVSAANGVDSDICGSPESPCRTIQKAIEIAQGQGVGPNITIEAGTYEESVSLGGVGAALLGVEGNPSAVTITSPGGAVNIGGPGSFFLTNLTMDGQGTGHALALNDARDVVISDSFFLSGAAGLAVGNSTGIQLFNNITIVANTGIALGASTLVYNGGDGNTLTITGPANGTGVGIQINGGEMGTFGDIDIMGYEVGIVAEIGSTMGVGSQAGSGIHDNTVGAVFRGSHIQLAGVVVNLNTSDGIVALNGTTMELNGVSVMANLGIGLRIGGNSSVQLLGSSIQGNSGTGVKLSTLSSLSLEDLMFPPSMISGNGTGDGTGTLSARIRRG